MRVFVAINLPDNTKDNLWRSSQQLQSFATKGNYVPRDNYHITLHFLGDVDVNDLIYIQSAMDAVKDMPAPTVAVQQVCAMRASDLAYAKLRYDSNLIEIHDVIGNLLERNGFAVEHSAYRPHVTLVRKYGFNMPFSEVSKNVTVYNKPFTANEVVLYQSVFENNGVTYLPLYSVNLK